jgi:hypothetical protein
LKTYRLFAACYLGICPQTKIGLYGILVFSLIVLVCSLLSRAPLKADE